MSRSPCACIPPSLNNAVPVDLTFLVSTLFGQLFEPGNFIVCPLTLEEV